MIIKFMRLKEISAALISFSIYVNDTKEMSLRNGETKTLEVKSGSIVTVKLSKSVADYSFKIRKEEDIIVIMHVKRDVISQNSITAIIVKEGSLISINT